MAVTRARARSTNKPRTASKPKNPVSSQATTFTSRSKRVAQTPNDLPILPFPNAAAFESYLEEHHATIPGLHLKHVKKSSSIPSISTTEALEVALCFGWINGQGNSCPEEPDYYLARYTPRRPKSTWSQINVKLAERLIEEGRMRPAGQAAIDAAKADGRWGRAYSAPTNMTVPADFQAALDANAAAKSFFDTLGKSERYLVLLKVELASLAARQNRIQALIDNLAVGKVPGSSTATRTLAPPASRVRKARTKPR
ncbi:hypothetical protein LTR64_008180 [Lithohypha guttulata]|uniref:uncharacterized protein n=1 Tax=Lithohypha guttulata TaxID=1690604 RepID=UPI002DDECC1D|nr:hypothetical protein LTR51_008332 [Lithohypha guttulata]